MGATVGASGMFGLVGATLLLSYRDARFLGQASRSRMWLWFALLIGLAISFLPGVSMAGHVGGLIGGPLLATIAKVGKMPNHTVHSNRFRSHDAVIRVYDESGNVIETREHAGITSA